MLMFFLPLFPLYNLYRWWPDRLRWLPRFIRLRGQQQEANELVSLKVQEQQWKLIQTMYSHFLPWALKCPWTNSWRKGGEKQKGNPNGENYCFSHGTNRQLPPILKIGKTTLFYPNSDFLSPSDPSETCGYLPISSSFSQSPKTPKETFDCRTLFHTDSLSRSSNNLNGKRTIISAAIGELEAAFLYL